MNSIFVKSMILGIVVASCGFSQSAGAQDQYAEAELFASPQLSYRYVVNEVFRPRCYRCHSDKGGNKGDLNLETYTEVYENRAKIREMAIVKKAMPPRRAGGPLNARQLRILDNWLMAGAPLSALVEPFEFDAY